MSFNSPSNTPLTPDQLARQICETCLKSNGYNMNQNPRPPLWIGHLYRFVNPPFININDPKLSLSSAMASGIQGMLTEMGSPTFSDQKSMATAILVYCEQKFGATGNQNNHNNNTITYLNPSLLQAKLASLPKVDPDIANQSKPETALNQQLTRLRQLQINQVMISQLTEDKLAELKKSSPQNTLGPNQPISSPNPYPRPQR